MNELQNTGTERQVTVNETLLKAHYLISTLKRKWKIILLSAVLGGILGLLVSFVVKPSYAAICTFVLEDNEKNFMGQFSGLASLAGIDISAGSSGIFKGDNIMELYKSRVMMKKALLTEAEFNGKKQKLIDRYAAKHKLYDDWNKDNELRNINFNGNPEKFNRKQDSLLTGIIERFNKKQLDVSKPDKKLSIIKVEFTDKDELFAKAFNDALVSTVNDFYVQTKTKKAVENLSILQHQADSVKRVLNSSISGVASAIDAAPNANPALLSLRVPSQRRQVDVQANTAIYSEIVKNLEVSKISLRQQTPLIQFIDQPVFPLKKTNIGKVKGIVAGAFLGVFFISIYLLLRWTLAMPTTKQ